MIDPKFIDIDFPTQQQYVAGDLGIRALDQRCAAYGDSINVIPESRWKEEAAAIQAAGGGCSQLVSRIYNQGQEGSCVANACSQALEIIQAKQIGKANVVPLSAISLYKRIGRSAQSGAMVSDGLEEMASRGILPLDTPANRAKYGAAVMPNTGFREPYPAGWEATALKFRATEWFILRSVPELITALIRQEPVVVGRDRHSICYCDPVYQGNSLLAKYVNSWGESFGENGFGYDSIGKIRSSASWAFALRAATINL